jgi:hypothetical protein
MADIVATFETSPRLTEAQIAQVFATMGDGPFYKCVEGWYAGGGIGSGTGATIGVELDRTDRDRVEGMKIEMEMFLRSQLLDAGVVITSLDMLEPPAVEPPRCDDHPDADLTMDESKATPDGLVPLCCDDCGTVIDV